MADVKTKTKSAKSRKKKPIKEHFLRGVSFALLAIIVGIIVWVALWQYGFMTALVAFAMAYLAIRLYKFGAGTLGRTSAYILTGLVAAGIVLAFLGGMASDGLRFYLEDSGRSDWLAALASADFWDFFVSNIFFNTELLSSYAVDMLIALVFGVLGAYGDLRALFSGK